MSFFGKHWKFDGVQAAFVMRGVQNGRYTVVFEREYASIEDIEGIDWAHPTIEHTDTRCPDELGLPEGYGFEVVKISYNSNDRSYRVDLQVESQYLGDVTGYQAQVADLESQVAQAQGQVTEAQAQAKEAQAQAEAAEAAVAEKDATIAAQAQEIEELKAGGDTGVVESLQAAYQEGVESNG